MKFQEGLSDSVRRILLSVQKNGDGALQYYSNKFDGIHLTPKQFEISQKEIKSSINRISESLKSALLIAKKRVEFFHKTELKKIKTKWSASLDGFRVGQIARSLDTVGLYIPGGRTCYPSTVLMTAIPAKVAGVRNVVLITPKKNLKDEILSAAALCGVNRVFCIGGPQGIAALAYGTKTIPKVEKIVGPGNQYVTEAKRQLYGQVGIDGLAGPSEIVVWADRSSNPTTVALNLMAQAEHDPLAKSTLVTTDLSIKKIIMEKIPTKFHTQMTWIVNKSPEKLMQAVNSIAPEHLYLAVRHAGKLLPKIKSAGAIFLGEQSPVALGDYVAGPSHVLPTGESAKFSSGLSVKDFLKWSSVIEKGPKANKKVMEAGVTLAKAEGLHYHSLSMMQN